MDKIYDTDLKFNFDKLILSKPISQNGSYFIKYNIGDFPLYIRPPKATIKQIIKSTKKSHCDLLFSQENENFIQWMENLENHSQQTIYKNREQWFESGLELEDIENSFTSPMKSYKSGKFYIVRTNISQRLGKIAVKIFNEDENDVPLEDVSSNSNVMTILEIQGIKCSSKSFQIDIELKQMMIINPIDFFDKCILRPSINNLETKDPDLVKLEPDLVKLEPDLEDPDLEKPDLEDPDLVKLEPDLEKPDLEKPDLEKPDLEKPDLEKLDPDLVKINLEEPDLEEPEEKNELCEVDFNLEEMSEQDTFKLKERDDVYYDMYREALRKAKVAKDLALSAYLEAKEIKNKYMLDSISDSDESDYEEE